ncbi:Aste57867_24377 [Aphanomyces stellatus]|uniref:Aste57867_24377 protein n=1 Tax=Aphanomyces stellatus TaxID=120398 RepID=A0A485LQH8_9STRA|nr:hypothetical protein As57867_024301 [Aphanomyces stellatus]VFU01017.1 Aste57867_24377 [Aphanomyces stellatus]
MKLFVQLTLVATLLDSAAAGICSAAAPGSWDSAAQSNPQLAPALKELSKHAVATWYTDRWGADIDSLLSKCGSGDIPSIVIYGLPNKDCADGFSSGGSNKSADDYKKWIQSLVSKVGSREVIYVLEPDAIGLLSNNNCAKQNDYMGNLKAALGLISAGNPKAKVYADVASWATQGAAAGALNELKSAGRLAGITINTSNYKTNDQLMSACQFYSGATGGLHCAFDTSRNYRGSVGDEWCNSRTAGIGAPPGPASGLVDYYLWLKVPGESDGQCTGRTPDAMQGPAAGAFFVDGFTSLWNNGWFVANQGLPKIGGGGAWPSNPTTSPPAWTATPATTAAPSVWTAPPTTTPAPTTKAPTTTTAVPTTTATPEPTTATPEPTTSTPEPTTVTPEPTTETPEPTTVTPEPTDALVQAVGVDAPTTTTTAAPIEIAKDISVQNAASGPKTDIVAGLLIGACAVAGVVATVLAIMVIRKRNAREKNVDRRDDSSIMVLGDDTNRAMQIL